MNIVNKLSDFKINVLPPIVVMLLSKYAHRLRKQTGIVLKLSSKTVLKELEEINNDLDDDLLNRVYLDIVSVLGSLSDRDLEILSDNTHGYASVNCLNSDTIKHKHYFRSA